MLDGSVNICSKEGKTPPEEELGGHRETQFWRGQQDFAAPEKQAMETIQRCHCWWTIGSVFSPGQ